MAAIADPGVGETIGRQGEKIGVVGNQDTVLGAGECELLSVVNPNRPTSDDVLTSTPRTRSPPAMAAATCSVTGSIRLLYRMPKTQGKKGSRRELCGCTLSFQTAKNLETRNQRNRQLPIIGQISRTRHVRPMAIVESPATGWKPVLLHLGNHVRPLGDHGDGGVGAVFV